MKSLIIIAGIIFTSTFSAQAGPGELEAKELKTPPSIQKQIEKQMGYPLFAKEFKIEGESILTFKIKKDGSIEVMKVTGKDVRLNKFVSAKAKRFRFKTKESQNGQVYSVTFTFRILV
jgi:outer membrane biosynthesis protein TonB